MKKKEKKTFVVVVRDLFQVSLSPSAPTLVFAASFGETFDCYN
jgi:hypothetical protein